jgi:hypothetical protein
MYMRQNPNLYRVDNALYVTPSTIRKLHLFLFNLMTIPHLWRKNTMDVDENEKRCRINVLETTTHQLIDIYQSLQLKSVLGLVNFLWVQVTGGGLSLD